VQNWKNYRLLQAIQTIQSVGGIGSRDFVTGLAERLGNGSG
jgi:hypothetical protein